jgi:hypothetical protein
VSVDVPVSFTFPSCTVAVGVARPPASAALVFLGTTMPWYCHSPSSELAEKQPISEPNEAGHFEFENSTRSQYRYHLASGSQKTTSKARTEY